MANIIFFGKTNCINNNKQKTLLKAAGHRVDEQDILNYIWDAEQLRAYFGDAPIAQWFNMTAPAIKSETVLIDGISEQEALNAMIRDPILVRRPLMDIDGHKVCGFRYGELDALIGLSPVAGHEKEMQALRSEDITTCPFQDTLMNCNKLEKQ